MVVSPWEMSCGGGGICSQHLIMLRAFIASFVGYGDENLVCSSGFDHVKAFAPSRELNRVADFLCALYCNSCSMMYCPLPYVLFSSCAGKPLKFFMSCSYWMRHLFQMRLTVALFWTAATITNQTCDDLLRDDVLWVMGFPSQWCLKYADSSKAVGCQE